MNKTIFHVHGPLCRHAEDEKEEKYVLRAIELGANRICFSDHSPLPGNEFRMRMLMEEFPAYLSYLRELKTKYADKIDIRIGVEAEYIPIFKDHYEMLKEELDFILLGQHFSLLPNGSHTFEDRKTMAEARALADGMIQGMESGYFDVVAHPDQIFRRVRKGEWGEEEEQMAKEIKECAISHDIILEQNISNRMGKKKKRTYRPEFWKDLPVGLRTIYGLDAHSVEELKENYQVQQQFQTELFKNLVPLSEYEILRVSDEPIFISHKTKGMWWDMADGVYSVLDMNELYLSGSDTWLDCNKYKEQWIAYFLN